MRWRCRSTGFATRKHLSVNVRQTSLVLQITLVDIYTCWQKYLHYLWSLFVRFYSCSNLEITMNWKTSWGSSKFLPTWFSIEWRNHSGVGLGLFDAPLDCETRVECILQTTLLSSLSEYFVLLYFPFMSLSSLSEHLI